MKYNIKAKEFIDKLKKNHPRIHSKEIYIPNHYYGIAKELLLVSFFGQVLNINLAGNWHLRSNLWFYDDVNRDLIRVWYKNEWHYYPVSDLFEDVFDTKMKDILDETS
jgi:hypothetical protein